ncbi:Transcription factor bHLH85 [Hordeum vulgare]|nr:Transcription factor bHLH85 [Hordeum vulgare]
MDITSNTTTTTSGGGGGKDRDKGKGASVSFTEGEKVLAYHGPSSTRPRWTVGVVCIVKARAGRGQASDPQNLYAKRRREKINDKLRVLQKLVPNGTKVDLSTMLEEAVLYVQFLQLRIKNMSYAALFGQFYLEKLSTPGGDPRHLPHHPRRRVRRSTPWRASHAAATAPGTKAARAAHTEVDSAVQSIKEVVGGHLSPTPTDDLAIVSR